MNGIVDHHKHAVMNLCRIRLNTHKRRRKMQIWWRTVRRLVSSIKEQVVTFGADHSRCDQIIERLQTEHSGAK